MIKISISTMTSTSIITHNDVFCGSAGGNFSNHLQINPEEVYGIVFNAGQSIGGSRPVFLRLDYVIMLNLVGKLLSVGKTL